VVALKLAETSVMTELAGERTVVMRPHEDWHLYERQRRWYDRVWDWYTVEGPFIRKHDGRYWCFYSGGAWKDENYGVSSAVADHPMGPYEPVTATDTADVLRTVPGKVIGPGHGSVAVAPDNITEYLLYHAWDLEHTGRFLHADRLLWDAGRPQSPGPCTAPQPLPPEPQFRDLFSVDSRPGSGKDSWSLRGAWERRAGALHHPGGEEWATAVLSAPAPPAYLFEVNLAVSPGPARGGTSGVSTEEAGDGSRTAVFLDTDRRELRWTITRGDECAGEGALTRLPPGFRADAFHQLVVHQQRDQASFVLDGVHVGTLPERLWRGSRLGVWTSRNALEVAGVALTGLP